jgi:hypothetical protein
MRDQPTQARRPGPQRNPGRTRDTWRAESATIRSTPIVSRDGILLGVIREIAPWRLIDSRDRVPAAE